MYLLGYFCLPYAYTSCSRCRVCVIVKVYKNVMSTYLSITVNDLKISFHLSTPLHRGFQRSVNLIKDLHIRVEVENARLNKSFINNRESWIASLGNSR